MKSKLKLSLAIMVALGLSACSSDDEATVDTPISEPEPINAPPLLHYQTQASTKKCR